MGIWDYIRSWTDSLKRNAPDLTKIGNAADLQALKQNLPDDEGRQKIAQFTTCLAKNAAIETIKSVPGGDSVRKVVTKSYEEVYRGNSLPLTGTWSVTGSSSSAAFRFENLEVAPDSYLFNVFSISHASPGSRKTNS
ncbi:hypothetical protein FEM48_Zijuj01G0207000 [Ziziphus jujuba var. spinosa]|uniref:Uncharacterized protein n=1 Tax=Ziziphus jujuba var. spinosa TaxID=714518 RepID=A0A978W3G2_ZIZJJ|nr:hypothetical protein FEM48_Zijuj01G0207000 [Ziziphus jujuba var. spinosa]